MNRAGELVFAFDLENPGEVGEPALDRGALSGGDIFQFQGLDFGVQGLYFEQNTEFQHVYDALLHVTGDLTLSFFIVPEQLATTGQLLMRFGGDDTDSGGPDSDNVSYGVDLRGAAQTFRAFHEFDGGTDQEYTSDEGIVLGEFHFIQSSFPCSSSIKY